MKKLKLKDSNKILKWNFIMGLVDGIFIVASKSFYSPNIVIPLFLDNLNISKSFIGFFSTVMGNSGGIMGGLPQLFIAKVLENKIHKKPLLLFATFVRTLCWGILALMAYFFAEKNPLLTAYSLLIILLLFTFMGGVARVPFLDIFGKAIPQNLRGRFFGYRNFWGSVMAVVTGFLAKIILGNDRILFPLNFSLLFLLAFLSFSVANIAVFFIKEPKEEIQKNSKPLKDFLKNAFNTIKNNKNFKNYLIVMVLSGGGALAFPFYILYAKEVFRVSLELMGLFLLFQAIGAILGHLLWAHISDFIGNKKVLQISTILVALIPLVSFIANKAQTFIFTLVFVLIGFSLSGLKLANTNFVLDIAPKEKRLIYISLSGVLKFPIMIFPFVGGIILQYASYKILFIVTFFVTIMGGIFSLSLKEPKEVK